MTALSSDLSPADPGLQGLNLRHIGIIMDGNGRWARQRGLFRTQGHLEGLKAAKRIVKAASDFGVSFLTLYAFSTENWKRATDEVGFIMGLVKQYLREELDFYRENRIKLRHTGNREGLPTDIIKELDDVCEETRNFEGLEVILALNYGGRDEIIRAINKYLSGTSFPDPDRSASASAVPEPVTEEKLRGLMDNPDVPDPDMIIRTAGEFRTSNFLLWEGAYAEYYISDKLWPDWTGNDLAEAIKSFQGRERRFGGITG